MSTKTYAGIPQKYAALETSKIVLIPVPYDGTSTWQKGADKGPEAFLDASENMELYDIETQTEVYKQGVYLADAITENSSPEAVVSEVHKVTKDYIKRNKFVTIFAKMITSFIYLKWVKRIWFIKTINEILNIYNINFVF